MADESVGSGSCDIGIATAWLRSVTLCCRVSHVIFVFGLSFVDVTLVQFYIAEELEDSNGIGISIA